MVQHRGRRGELMYGHSPGATDKALGVPWRELGQIGSQCARDTNMNARSAASEITLAETAELVACLVTAHGPQFLHAGGRHGLSALLAMEPLTVHAAVALTLLEDTNRAVALSLAGQWALPENVASQVVQFAMAALPEAMAAAEAAMTYARERQDEVSNSQANHTCGDLLAVIDAVDRNLRAGRRMVSGMTPSAPATSKGLAVPVHVPLVPVKTVPVAFR